MKLLIIAGPYEADRIRKAALAAGFETVAVEPGESLSGWITASRPELIVMAPQIVNPDPALALGKVRAVPRGRVPIFLVGDAADEARMRDLADGFFVRPVAPELLLERARAILSPRRAQGSGPRASDALERTEMGLGPSAPVAPASASVGGTNVAQESSRGGRTPKSGPSGPHGVAGPQASRPGVTLKPLVATSAVGGAARGGATASALLAELDAGIDALFDAELSAAVAVPRKTQSLVPVAAGTGPQPSKPDIEPELAGVPSTEVHPTVEPDAQQDLPEFDEALTREVQPILLGAAFGATASNRARTRILARYAPVEDGDYFAVLGLGRDASLSELRRAHERILRELAPDAIDPQLARELAAQIDAIRAVSAEAVRVLGDEGLRPRYLSHLPK